MDLPRRLFLFFLLYLFTTPLFGQFPGQGGFGGSGGQPSTQGEFVELIDTFGVYYFYVDNPNEETPFSDTLLNHFQQYDPIRTRDFEYANLGNQGSPARPLFFQPAYRKGFDLGLHQFDIYHIDKTNIPYYRLENPFTRAAYSQNNKDNLSFKGEYSRNFSDGINMSIYALRTNHVGQFRNQRSFATSFANNWWYHDKKGKYDGFFAVISNSNLNLDNGGIVLPPDSIVITNPVTIPVNIASDASTKHTERSFTYTHYYKLIGAVPTIPAAPSIQPQQRPNPQKGFPQSSLTPKDSLMLDSLMQESKPEKTVLDTTIINTKDSLILPSVSSDTLGNKTNPSDSLVLPVASMVTDTMLNDSSQGEVVLENLGLEKRISVDSLGENKPTPNIQPPLIPKQSGPPKRAITLGHQFGYHSNRYLFSDNSPDTSFYDPKFLPVQRGIRSDIHHQKIENDFRISTFKLRDQKGKVRNQQDLLEAGLTHTLHFITQENEQRNVNNLFLHGRFNFNPRNRLKINTYFHYGLLANLGDYRAKGTLKYSLPTLGSLEVDLVQQAYAPSLISERLILSETVIWENDFNRIFETSLKATLSIPRLELEISGQYHLVNNYQFYGTDGSPQQTGSVINVGQLMVKKHFKFWKFHLDNTIILQQTSNNVLRLPKLLTKQSFYFAGYLLKRALFSHVGIDFRLNNNFRGDSYFAPTGQFQLQDEAVLEAYPLLDVFVDFKVKEFRFFAKYENLTRLWYPTLAFQTYLHPERFNFVRFGVSWRFLN